jgi:hypothetical protein
MSENRPECPRKLRQDCDNSCHFIQRARSKVDDVRKIDTELRWPDLLGEFA